MRRLLDLLHRRVFRSDYSELERIVQKVKQEHQQGALASIRSMLDLATAWRIAMERPEVDMRDDIDVLIRDLSDQIAVMEEHAA